MDIAAGLRLTPVLEYKYSFYFTLKFLASSVIDDAAPGLPQSGHQSGLMWMQA